MVMRDYRTVLSWGWFFFFFQAEDGIRDGTVTGVQTCALPIFLEHLHEVVGLLVAADLPGDEQVFVEHHERRQRADPVVARRSEERRVGKECRSRSARDE